MDITYGLKSKLFNELKFKENLLQLALWDSIQAE